MKEKHLEKLRNETAKCEIIAKLATDNWRGHRELSVFQTVSSCTTVFIGEFPWLEMNCRHNDPIADRSLQARLTTAIAMCAISIRSLLRI
jgi:hypothetical protein